MLSVQYRMHPKISRFISHYFYQGLLEDGPGLDRFTVTRRCSEACVTRHTSNLQGMHSRWSLQQFDRLCEYSRGCGKSEDR